MEECINLTFLLKSSCVLASPKNKRMRKLESTNIKWSLTMHHFLSRIEWANEGETCRWLRYLVINYANKSVFRCYTKEVRPKMQTKLHLICGRVHNPHTNVYLRSRKKNCSNPNQMRSFLHFNGLYFCVRCIRINCFRWSAKLNWKSVADFIAFSTFLNYFKWFLVVSDVLLTANFFVK